MSQISSNVNLLEIGNISFKRIETDRYPLWELKDDLLKRPKKGLVLNSANEIAIRRFKMESIILVKCVV